MHAQIGYKKLVVGGGGEICNFGSSAVVNVKL
jgi:hypothetical protein